MHGDRQGVIDDIGATALGIAFARAEESRRQDRLFEDPYAGAFVAAGSRVSPIADLMTGAGGPSDASGPWRFLLHHVAIRTRFLDDVLLDAACGGCRQVVLLGAGLDTRALRLAWPAGTRVFELDQAPVLSFKERVLGAAAHAPARATVPVDLREDWEAALVGAGFDARQPAAWLLEGFLPALTEAEADMLLSRLTALAAPGCRLAFEELGATPAVRRLLEQLGPGLVDLWRRGTVADPAAWLAGHGWDAEVLEQAEVSLRWDRQEPAGPSDGPWPRPRLITARRRTA